MTSLLMVLMIKASIFIGQVKQAYNFHFPSIMQTLYLMESDEGRNTKSRFEKKFLEKYREKGMMPELIQQYGERAAASSYGDYQIMLVVAWERGFKVSPEQLEFPTLNKKVAEAQVNYIISKVGYNPEAIFRRYNGGGSPVYIEKAMIYYDQFVKLYSEPLVPWQ